MFSLPAFINKRVVYVGNDNEATALQKFLEQYASVENFIIVDHGKLSEVLRDGDVIIKSHLIPAKEMNHVYTTPMRIFFDCASQAKAPIIGVTGTRGKTTLTSLIHHILKSNNTPSLLYNDVSEPLFTHAHELNENSRVTLELSSKHLAELEVSPDIAIITTLGSSDLDYHSTIDAYWAAMENILKHMNDSNHVIFSQDTEMVFHWLANKPIKQHIIDSTEQVDMANSQLFGEQNRKNYLMARTAANLLGVEKFVAKSALDSFESLPHRLKVVRDVNGVVFVDDSASSTSEESLANLEACIRHLKPVGCVLIGGSENSNETYEPLIKLVSTLRIPSLVLLPDDSEKIRALLPESYTPQVLETSSIDDAVSWALENTPSGSVCLLSRGAPTSSGWKDYKEQGDQFVSAVEKL